ncbi:pseudaminic acid synthase [Roseospira marina]|uniref:Pseudaminic acid synthase n=2 Tax=Roseospira marina TaxID=140057 RepID=A0A5M6I6V7_9PROT|nr:pseudaminic acid synthase [Roseospira marina]
MAPLMCVEMSGNHQGRLEAALAFVDEAKARGADLLKVQVYRPDTITLHSDRPDFRLPAADTWSEYGTLYDLYAHAHTPWDWIEAMFRHGEAIGLPVFASPFDETAVDLLERLGCPIYKIASPEIGDIGLIEACARTGKPVILSTGLASKEDLDRAVATIRRFDAPLMILKCVSAYPTPAEDMNVATVPWLRETYGCAVGLSDHTVGLGAACAAAALGARLVEKHFKLPGDDTSVDAKFSLDLDRLPEMKQALADAAASVGTATMEIPEIARPSLSGRRSLYVVAAMRKGEVFTRDTVRSIRPCYGMAPMHLPDVLGKVATRDIERGERMSWDLVADPA